MATVVVSIGLYLEYEQHELRISGLAKTRKLHLSREFRTKKLHRRSRKNIGSFLVVSGVIFEALLGLFAFTSAMIRETQSQVQIAELGSRARLLGGENRRILVAELKESRFARQKAEIRFCDVSFNQYFVDPDTLTVAGRLQGVLQESGWNANFPDRHRCNGTGIWIQVSSKASGYTRDAAAFLATSLKTLPIPIEANQTADLVTPQEAPKDVNAVVITVEAHPL